ncbi:histone deacetylase [Anaeromyces robustus]|uniref:Histone deacetylase n=1 Tax=Anaeromyces robustus TaxID=1754192 RepID=A0A1Y1VQZ1_9FUNG|nr:histone deacetylase [Anaeromyces robustus]|eukprot:ORX63722.1 histone deacetylase [Anaeromyces robustus]
MEKGYLKRDLTDSQKELLKYYTEKQLAEIAAGPKKEKNKKVSYFYNSDIGYHDLGSNHPLKPYRLRMAHILIIEYELGYKMDILKAKPATNLELTQFHSDEYINFLSNITPDKVQQNTDNLIKFNLGIDSPIFDGVFDYATSIAGASIEAAARLNQKKADIAINWAGGQHNAKKNEANGCCYINDVVLAILELLRVHKRVLYINMDIHHCNGVEEAFYTTNRVLTISFHKYGNIYPGTGHIEDIGLDEGKGYAINCPLQDGIDDATYKNIFEEIVPKANEYYKPDCIVLQCGADNISGDRLGGFNLTVKGHGECVRIVRDLDLPLLVLGGGGYSLKNVARTWTYDTAILNNCEINDVLPMHEYINYYYPDYQLDIPPKNMNNLNTKEYLNSIKLVRIIYICNYIKFNS